MIREVYIENIKSYKRQRINFTRGLNAIIGENGAGKTTILESIGFALFNTLPYNISDFIRRGESRGEIRLKLESPSDGREYWIIRKIERDRTAEYYVEDPELGRVAEGVKDVKSWVKTHFMLEMEPDTFFENAIGVNQGNLTSHFLLPPSARESIFSPLLGIEKYRKAFDKSRDYINLVEGKLSQIENELLRIEERISYLKAQKDELSRKREQLELLFKEKNMIESELEALQKEFKELEEIEKEIRGLEGEIKIAEADIKAKTEELKMLNSKLAEIEKLESEVRALEDSYRQYLSLSEEINTLESEKEKFEKLLERFEKIEKELTKYRETCRHLENEIESAKRELENYEEIRKKGYRERELEGKLLEIEKMENNLINLRKLRNDYLDRLRKLSKEIEEIEGEKIKKEKVFEALKKLEGVEEKRSKLLGLIGSYEQKKKNIEKTIEKIGEGICPVLNQSCERVIGEKERQIEELRLVEEKIRDLKSKLVKYEELVSKKSELEKALSALKSRIEREKEIIEEIESLENKVKEADEKIGILEKAVSEKDRILEELNNLKGSYELFLSLEKTRKTLEEKISELNKSSSKLEELERSMEGYEQAKSKFEEVKGKIKFLKEKIQPLKDKYERYVYLSAKVAERKELEDRKSLLENEIRNAEFRISELKERYEIHKQKFDLERYEQLKSRIEDLRNSSGEINGKIKVVQELIVRMEEDVRTLDGLSERMEKLRLEKEKIEKKLSFMKDLREVFRKAIPELVRAYSEVVSGEATRIFCEIMDDFSWQIEWTEDYGIRAKYMGRDIDFRQMSGGEQMVAAIAVRLALLKTLSASPFIFLDEPTQNMDADRRRNFAQQLSRISDFKQVFVISHDDTFEEMVENAIRVRKENGVSVV